MELELEQLVDWRISMRKESKGETQRQLGRWYAIHQALTAKKSFQLT